MWDIDEWFTYIYIHNYAYSEMHFLWFFQMLNLKKNKTVQCTFCQFSLETIIVFPYNQLHFTNLERNQSFANKIRLRKCNCDQTRNFIPFLESSAIIDSMIKNWRDESSNFRQWLSRRSKAWYVNPTGVTLYGNFKDFVPTADFTCAKCL